MVGGTYPYTRNQEVPPGAAVDKKRWIFKGFLAAIRSGKNRIIFLMILLKFGRPGL